MTGICIHIHIGIVYDKGKHFPDLFLKAIDVLAIDSRNVIIFEDSVSGIKAAEAAGTVVIVNSNDGDYKAWEGKHPIIKHFSEVNWDWLRDRCCTWYIVEIADVKKIQ